MTKIFWFNIEDGSTVSLPPVSRERFWAKGLFIKRVPEGRCLIWHVA